MKFYAWFIVWVLWQVSMKLHTLRFSVMRHEFRSLYLLLRAIPFTSVKYHVVAYLAEYSHEGEISWIQVKVICKSKCYSLHSIYTSLAVLFWECRRYILAIGSVIEHSAVALLVVVHLIYSALHIPRQRTRVMSLLSFNSILLFLFLHRIKVDSHFWILFALDFDVPPGNKKLKDFLQLSSLFLC
jgi:hypothetical protein